jgi:hypothetical protein
LRTAAADTGLTEHFSEKTPALAVARLLADLTMLYRDDPTVAQRGVVMAPPRSWLPSSPLVEGVLAALAESPILQPVTVGDFFERTRPSTARGRVLVRRPVAPPSPPTTGLPAGSIRSSRRQIEAFGSAVDPLNPILDRLDRTLLVTPSTDLRPRDRTRYLSGINEQIGTEVRQVTMLPTDSITLTGRVGHIPVTVRNGLPYPVRARLRISSDTLDFPEGAERELALAPRRNTPTNFVVKARTSGSFPLRVELLAPQGDLVLTQGRYTVRSTAISGAGTVLSIGAGLFLLLWWGNHLRGRRSRRLIPA